MEKGRFKVVIIGGSIAGLTLAHCLDRARIDYIVLEKNHHIHPQIGGSIGLMPNGSRILAQLGLYEQVDRLSSPIEICHIGFPDGFTFSDHFPRKIHERHVNLSRLPLVCYAGGWLIEENALAQIDSDFLLQFSHGSNCLKSFIQH